MTNDRYAHRRAEFLDQLGDTIAVIPAGQEQIRNDDVEHAFRQNSDFFFLTGFPEPDAIAVFDPGHDTESYVLFVRERDVEMEAWNGRRAGPEGAVERFGADAAHTIDEFDAWFRKRLRGRTSVGYTLGGSYDARIVQAITSAKASAERLGFPIPASVSDPRHILHEMRLVKSPFEIDALREACRISAIGHREAMKYASPGRTEGQVQAAMEYVFASLGSERVGYGSIVAGGDNACILHYVENDQPLNDGDLLLIDAAAEFHHLTADITRTFPVNGTFSAAQRAVYEVVLEAEQAVIDICAPGLPFTDMHERSVEVLTAGMVDLGLLPGPADEAIAKGWYREFFFHGTGHWLGVDVHDAGDYRIDGKGRPLVSGMAFTVEPGIYVAPEKGSISLSHAEYDADALAVASFELGASKAKADWAQAREDAGMFDFEVPEEFLGIGVRIEDNILITDDGYANLTDLVPVSIADVEALVAERSELPIFG